jgi:geranyl-CoA carboxylase beta subunit
VCGHAALHGQRIGIIGNNGPIQPGGRPRPRSSSSCATSRGTPLLFLQNTTGYMVGKASEQAGAIKHGSKMIQAVANARVPKFTVCWAAASAPATTACAAAASTRASSSPGPARAPR